jgi:hypothetical protein
MGMRPAVAFVAAMAVVSACNRDNQQPARFGVGRAATAVEIQKIDIDAEPDGAGLPAGRGTAASAAVIFATRCAGCHGPAGEGTPVGMALVGRVPGNSFTFASAQAKERTKTIGNYWPYATTLYDYIHRAMPYDHPGTLAPDEVYSVVAFLLARNNIIKDDVVIDSASLTAIRMPTRDRFVVDDREKSTHVL